MNTTVESLLTRDVTEFIHAAAWTLLHFIWQGLALACICASLSWAAGRCSAQTRYLVGCGTLAAMAIAPIVTFACLWNSPTSPLIAAGDALAARAPVPLSSIDPTLLSVVAVWLLGAAVCMLWLSVGWLQAERLRHLRDIELPERCRQMVSHLAGQLAEVMHVRAAVRVVDAATVTVPLAVGWLRPVILLPASLLSGLPAAQLQAIIAHEFAHVRRHDYLVNLVQTVIESLLFYHPAVWWVSRRIRLEREYCCDDIAASVCGDRVLYARALTELEALRSVPARLGLSSNGGSLMKRIVRLVDEAAPALSRPSRLPAAVAAMALLVSASAAFALMNPPRTSPVAEPVVETVQGMPLFTQAIAQQTVEAQRAECVRALMVEGHPLITADEITVDASQEGVWVLATEAQPAHATVQWQIAQETTAPLLLSLVQAVRAQPDPADMPSAGLMRAAQLAYPFRLFDLMPWIAPEAQDLAVPPEQTVEGVHFLRLRFEAVLDAAAVGVAPVKLGEQVTSENGVRTFSVILVGANEEPIEFTAEGDVVIEMAEPADGEWTEVEPAVEPVEP